MNTRSRKTKGFSQRLIALLLCGVCLLSASPVSAMASEVEAPQTAEESTTVVVVAVPQTQTENQELPKQEPDQELPAADPQKEAAEQENVQQEPVEATPAVSLYDRLMACTTVEEVNAILDCLTPEEEAELDAFTAEQLAAMEAHLTALGYYGTATLENLSYTIEQGGSVTVSVSSLRNSNFSFTCVQDGITARYSSNRRYNISVGEDVPEGTYELTVSYETGSYNSQSHTDTITVTVTKQKKLATVNSIVSHAVVTYYYYTGGQWVNGGTYTDQQTFSITYNLNDDPSYYVFFAKPEKNYLLSTFSIVNQGNNSTSYDLYSTKQWSESQISGYPGLEELVEIAEANDYLCLNGYKTSAAQSITLNQYFTGTQPGLNVSATADQTENVKPGDIVNFTVTVTPRKANTNDKITSLNVTSLTINGVTYENVTLIDNGDGTYTTTVPYTATADDWKTGDISLNVIANVGYEYVLPVKDRQNVTSEITTNSTITSSGKTTVTLANPAGVAYTLQFEAPEGITPPDTIPAAPDDDTEYFEGSPVTVKDYNRADVDDPANKGVWKFTGWKVNGEGDNKNAGDQVTMGKDKILFVGVWKFEKYPNRDLSVQKTLSGNMYNANDTFTFTVTYNDKTETFDLGKDQTNTLSIPVGAEVTITENPGTYTSSIDAVTPNTLEYKAITNGITFVMPAENVKVVINNHNEQTVDTGVLLDSLPYVLILGLVVAGAVLLIGKRRNRYED